jgi:hypothetical protein
MRPATPLTCFLAVAVSLALGPSAARAQPACVIDSTHYWTYELQTPQYHSATIFVRDQFLPEYKEVAVLSAWRLLNWVRKNDSPVRDTLNHFLWWEVEPNYEVGVEVEIDNQFGRSSVFVERLEFLLSPAYKNPPPGVPPHPDLSHYLCYRTEGFTPPTDWYFFVDEWRRDSKPVTEMEFLCAPCWKQHEGQEFAPMDTVTHLAVFRIFVWSDLFEPWIRDQFISMHDWVQQDGSGYLFVPSVKGELATPARHETWGRLKTLYR